MDRRFLAYLELRQDFLFDKIPKDKIMSYIDRSLQMGDEKVQLLSSRDINTLLGKAGIEIEHNEGSGDFFKVKLRAQFEYDPKGKNKIILYHQSIQEFSERSGLDLQKAIDLHLVHEYFHYLESRESKSVPERLEPVVNFEFLGLKKRAHINRCSEIAAHAFTQKYLDIEMLPNGYDFQYLINKGEITEAYLRELEASYQAIS